MQILRMMPPVQNNRQAIACALRLVAGKAYSRAELTDKLISKGFAPAMAADAIQYLEHYGYINDQTFCRNLINKYCKNNNYSRRAIVAKLKMRHFPNEIISACLEEMESWDEGQAAQKLVCRHFAGKHPESRQVAQFLSRKGFSAHTVVTILENTLSGGAFSEKQQVDLHCLDTPPKNI